MRKLLIAGLLSLAVPRAALATWSIIAIDIRTGQVIIASATCVRQMSFSQRQPNGARDLMDIQAVIVPGIGVAACQSGVDNTRENQMLVYNELRKGTSPAKILEMLKQDPNIERRQFGILAIPNGTTITGQNHMVGFNGANNSTSSLYFGGQVGDIYYQVQGNTLLGTDVVYRAALAITRASGTMADRVIAGMEAADENGGDKRCNCGNNPVTSAPCENRTAHVAYIAIANKDDQVGVTHNDGKYFAYITASDADVGAGESANPVKTLRMRYDAWKRAGSNRTAPPGPTMYRPAQAPGPNPVNLWVVDLKWTGNQLTAGPPTKLTNDNGTNSQPSFSPDGRSVVFSATRDTGAEARSDIYRIDLATRTETRVTRTPENENSPTVNAAGEYVAVRWAPATLFKEFGVWMYAADGTPTRGVLRGPDTTGYYTPLGSGNYALTRPKSKTFTVALFDAQSGTIADVDSGVPALPAQRVPGQRALSYVRIDSADGKHTLRLLDLATSRTSSIGATLVGRTAHAWIPGHNTVLMAKGNVLYARAANESGWRVVARFQDPDLRNASAYVVSPNGDKLVLTSPKRLGFGVVLRDSLEAGHSGAAVAAMATRWRDAGQLTNVDVTENPISALGDDRLQKKRFADAIALHTLATTFFPRSYRAPARLGDAQRAAGDSIGALASYRKSLELNPRATEADRAAASAIERKISGQPPLSDAASQSSAQGGTIAFVSTRYDSTADPVVDPMRAFLAAEIYLMDGDGTNARRITNNAYGDGFPSLSPDGRRIVFESNRLRKEAEALNTSDLFVMNADGTDQRALVRGSSASWSPDGRQIAFHASASGTGRPISMNPGSATSDADIFVARIDALLSSGAKPENLTHNPAAVDDDPDWSPDGRKIVFTSHDTTDKTDNHVTAEIYVITVAEKGPPARLTNNAEEERAPAWSPDGTRLLFSCRKGDPAQSGGLPTFELCLMNADGTGLRRLTNNAVPELTPSWSPDGRQVVFHRAIGGRGRFQLFVVNADGTGERQLTFPPGASSFAHWSAIGSR